MPRIYVHASHVLYYTPHNGFVCGCAIFLSYAKASNNNYNTLTTANNDGNGNDDSNSSTYNVKLEKEQCRRPPVSQLLHGSRIAYIVLDFYPVWHFVLYINKEK